MKSKKSGVRTKEEGISVQGAVSSSFASTEINQSKEDEKKGKQSENGTQESKKKTVRDPRILEEKEHIHPQGDKELERITCQSDAKLKIKVRAVFESHSSDRIVESDVAKDTMSAMLKFAGDRRVL